MDEDPLPRVSLTSVLQPPRLDNQVLLRELHLDDNSISSLQGLAACWLPLMQHLSVAKNRYGPTRLRSCKPTQLRSYTVYVSPP